MRMKRYAVVSLILACLAVGCGEKATVAKKDMDSDATQLARTQWQEPEVVDSTEPLEAKAASAAKEKRKEPQATETPEELWDDPEIADLMKKLGTNSPEGVSKAFATLVEKGADAIPALKKGLAHTSIRYACVEILTRIESVECTSVLLEALQNAHDKTSNGRMFKRYIIGGLGRLKDDYSVPILEKLYERQKDKEELLAISLAWALENITGNDYGRAYDPWMQGITIFPPPIGVKGQDE